MRRRAISGLGRLGRSGRSGWLECLWRLEHDQVWQGWEVVGLG